MKRKITQVTIVALAITMMSVISLGFIEIILRLFPEINRRSFYKVSWNHWKIGDDLKKLQEASDFYVKSYTYDTDIGYVKGDFIENIETLDDAKTPKNFNILILGDSVSETGTYVDKLTNIMDKDHTPKIDIVNAGVMGYDTKMEYEFLKKYGLSYNPDMVILQFNVNDFHGTPFIMKQRDGTWIAYDREYSGISVNQFFFERSELYKLYVTTLMRHRRKHVSPVEAVKPFLEAMNVLVKRNGTAFVVVYFPLFTDRDERDKSHTTFFDIVRELGIENNVLDLTAAYDKYNTEQISKDEWHPNVRGDQIAAEEIYKYIKPLIGKSTDESP